MKQCIFFMFKLQTVNSCVRIIGEIQVLLDGPTGNPKRVFCEYYSCGFDSYMALTYSSSTAFIWLKSIKEPAEDCQHFLKSKLGILARAGEAFGVSNQYARVSLVGRESEVAILLHRLAALK